MKFVVDRVLLPIDFPAINSGAVSFPLILVLSPPMVHTRQCRLAVSADPALVVCRA